MVNVMKLNDKVSKQVYYISYANAPDVQVIQPFMYQPLTFLLPFIPEQSPFVLLQGFLSLT